MWALNILPDWAWPILIASGIILLIASWIVKVYQLPMQLISILAITMGVWMHGVSHNNSIWESKIAELEKKVKIAEDKSAIVTEKIVYRTREKIVKVKQNVEVIRTEIQIQKEIINEGCTLNSTAVDLYNNAVNGAMESK